MNSADSADDGDDNIRVFVRVRPDSELDGFSCLSVDPAGRSVAVQCKPEAKVFTFDAVADAASTQESVFVTVARPLIDSCIAGYNATIFAYGQTGSGKTFTMLGPSEDDTQQNFQHELRGVIPRSFEHLFNLVARELELSSKNLEFLCKCSFLEIYNEQVFDLLDAASAGLHLRENIKCGVFVEGLSEEAVTNASEAYQVLVNGWQNRTVASTAMNRESSRSHAVFTIQVESKETKNGLQNIRQGVLNLVDLAGSERQKDTRTAGQRLKEAGSINKSLSSLGNVIMALVDVMNGKSRHVPYRDSKLTFLLRDSLGGNARTCMVACIHPGVKCLGETLSTLQYARRAKLIRNKAIVNEDTHGNVAALQTELRKLKEQLAQWEQGYEPTPMLAGGISGNAVARTEHLTNGHSCPGRVAQSCLGSKAPAPANDWKRAFLDAMLLLENVEKEKLEAEQRSAVADDLCTKQEKFLQSTKMIIKLRENCIRRLEMDKHQPVHDELVKELQKEVELLRSQLELNPALAKYAAENKNLKSELQRVLASATTTTAKELTLKRREELEALYRELAPRLTSAIRADDDGSDDGAAASHGGRAPPPSAAALERSRDQLQSLQATLESVRLQAAADRECSGRRQAELECELAALRRSYADLERLLAARQLQSRLDRDAAGEAHVQTLLGIATPKKSPCVADALKSAVASSASPLLPAPNFQEALDELSSPLATAEATGLEEQAELEAAAAAAAEALAEQIRRLQATNDELHEKLDAAESDGLKSRQQLTRLEHINQVLQAQNDASKQELEEASKRLAELSSALKAQTANGEFLQSKVDDLTVMLDYSERQVKESKAARLESELSAAKLAESLQSQLVKLRCELETLQLEQSTLNLDRTGLQEALDAVQAARAIDEDRLSAMQGSLAQERARTDRLEAELQEALSKLEVECRRNGVLLSQAQDGKARELAEAVGRCEQLTAERDRLSSELQDCLGQLDTARGQIELHRAEGSLLVKELNLYKDSSARLTARLQEQRVSSASLEHKANALAREILEKAEQLSAAHELADNRSLAIDELKKQLDALARSAELRGKKFEVEMAMMKDEYDTVSAECQKLGTELAQVNEALLKAKATIEQKSAVISTMQAEVEKRAHEIDELKAEREPANAAAAAALAPTPLPNQRVAALAAGGSGSSQRGRYASPSTCANSDELRSMVASLERDNESYRSRQAALGKLLEELEHGREEKDRELADLKVRLADYEKADADRAARMSQFESELFLLRQEIETRRSEASLNAKEATAARSALQAVEKSKDEALAEKYAAYNELTSLQMKYEAVMTEKLELEAAAERLKEIASRDHRELMHLQSELEICRERLSRQTDVADGLRDDLARVEKQNAALIGHQNLKQKIQYHMQLKEENIRLKEENLRLKEQVTTTSTDSRPAGARDLSDSLGRL